MKDPRRLLDGDGSEEQRALLRAAALEEPAADGQARVLAALGVAVPPAGAGSADLPSAATGDVTAGSGAMLGGASATKLVVLAVSSAVLLGAGALLWTRGEAPAGRDAAAKHEGATANESGALPRDDRARHEADRTGSVALEIEALERVRSELGRKDGVAAVAALDRYSIEHPRGVLAHEADVLRVEALLLEGQSARALELAQQLLRSHGESPHRARLEALARQAGAPSTP